MDSYPNSRFFDGTGNLAMHPSGLFLAYAGHQSNVVLAIYPTSGGSTTVVLAGEPPTCAEQFPGCVPTVRNSGLPNDRMFNYPSNVAFDSSGQAMYVVDEGNCVIVKVNIQLDSGSGRYVPTLDDWTVVAGTPGACSSVNGGKRQGACFLPLCGP